MSEEKKESYTVYVRGKAQEETDSNQEDLWYFTDDLPKDAQRPGRKVLHLPEKPDADKEEAAS